MLSLLALGVFGGLALLLGAAVAVPVTIVAGLLWLVFLPLRLLGLALGTVFNLIWWLCGLVLPVVVVGGIALAVGAAAGGTAPSLAGAAAPALLVLLGLWVCYRAMNRRAHAA